MSYRRKIFLVFPFLHRLGFLIGALFASGCATPPAPTSGFLSNYSSLKLDEDAGLYYSEPDPALKLSTMTHVIVLRDVKWRVEGDILGIPRSLELSQVFKERLRYAILKEVKGSMLVLETEKNLHPYKDMPGVSIYELEPAITSVDTGYCLARYLVGFGLGDAKVTVEARGKRSFQGREGVYQMVIFGRSHGNPHGGMNPRCLSAFYTLRLACDQAAVTMARRISQHMTPPDEKWWMRKQ